MLVSVSNITLDRYTIKSLKKDNIFCTCIDTFIEHLIKYNIGTDQIVMSHCDGIYKIHRGHRILETILFSEDPKVKRAQIPAIEFNFADMDKKDHKFIEDYLKHNL